MGTDITFLQEYLSKFLSVEKIQLLFNTFLNTDLKDINQVVVDIYKEKPKTDNVVIHKKIYL